MGGFFQRFRKNRRRNIASRRKKKSFHIYAWQLILVLVPLLFLTATFLRYDHIKMTELRDAVLAADEAGDSEGANPEGTNIAISDNLTKLREFTFSHIVVNFVEENGVNRLVFGTGTFYLEHQYYRAAQAALAVAEEKAAQIGSEGNPNGNIYAAASAVCNPLARKNRWAYNSPQHIDCMLTELQKYPASDKLASEIVADIPSTALYHYSYASPIWAPTPAGFMILLCLLIIIAIMVKFIVWLFIEISLFFLKKR